MQTLSDAHSRDAAYWGDRGDWLIAYSVHRDSDVLERSNFAAMKRRLVDADSLLGPSEMVAVETSSHWAVGWIDYLVVHPLSHAARVAEQLNAKIADYPVLDEELYSQMEHDEAWLAWQNASVKDRIHYLRRYCEGVSIFAARRDDLPEDESGSLVMALAN
jgi:hypothetical protein